MDFVVLHLGQSVAYLEILNANSGTAHILSWVTQMEKQDVHFESNYQRRLWQADRASIEMNLFYPCLDQVHFLGRSSCFLKCFMHFGR